MSGPKEGYRQCPFCHHVYRYSIEILDQAASDGSVRVNCQNCTLKFWPGRKSDIKPSHMDHKPIRIPHIPPLLSVDRLIGGKLPLAIFVCVPRHEGELLAELTIEEFIHLGFLPKDLQDKVRLEMRMATYRQLEAELRYLRATWPAPHVRDDLILERMAQIWPSLSKEQQDLLDAEGSTCFPPEFH